MKVLLTLSMMVLGASGAAISQTQPSHVVVFVRHGEKASDAPDALLSPAGVTRAQCLAQTLKEMSLREIIATDVKRTQEMAEPTAKEHNVEVRVIPKQNQTALLQAVQAQLGNTLVVNHSDTLPKILQDFTGKAVDPSVQFSYDEMFMVPVVDGKVGTAVVLYYCGASELVQMKR
jgi:phosphohistidine phosphatase SixA